MATGPQTVDFQCARQRELDEIRARRRKVDLSDEGVASTLVGLALSGGGLRSACFGLGFVQALCKSGLWRHIDYLSTVSGGTFLGSYLSSLVMQRKRNLEKGDCPIMPQAGGRQPRLIQKFIYAGQYLLKPWGLMNKYLVGLVFINLAVFSLLISVCALVAFLWRCLDYPWVRDRAALLNADNDLFPPFWPAMFFASCWLVAWIVSYWRRGAEAPGRFARFFLIATVASLLVGFALLIGNGDIALGGTAAARRGNQTLQAPASIWTTLIGLVAGGLLPLFTPQRLIRSGVAPRNRWEKYVFRIASAATLVGLPLLLIGLFAHENISSYNNDQHRALIKEDIQGWPQLCSLICLQPKLVPTEDEEFANILRGALAKPQDAEATSRDPVDVKHPAESLKSDAAAGKELHKRHLTSETEPYEKILESLESPESQVEQLRALLAEAEQELPSQASVGPANEYKRIYLQAVLLRELLQQQRLATEQIQGHGIRGVVPSIDHFVGRLHLFLGWFFGLHREGNPLEQYWQRKLEIERLQDRLAGAINERVLGSDEFLESQLQLAGQPESMAPAAGESPVSDTSAGDPEAAEAAKMMESWLNIISTDNKSLWERHEVAELNRLLLEQRFPNVFRARSKVRRKVSIEHDQWRRMAWCLGALGVFLAAGLWVDLNATSMHGFYRNQLSETFIVPDSGKSPSLPLSKLNVARMGSPYFVISASIGLLSTLQSPRWTSAGRSAVREAEVSELRVSPFIFSNLYCGSDLTRYIDTENFESFVRGDMNRLDLAEATALSGAAVSPGRVHNWLLAFLMFALNIRLGQWIPNPKAGPAKRRPNVLTLISMLRSNTETRPYCFITDGGHAENLGLAQLLRRRCRLILAVDASCDPHHQFADLSRAIRLARIHGGIRLVALETDDEGNEREFSAAAVRLGTKAKHGGAAEGKQQNRRDPDGPNADLPLCSAHFALARIVYCDAPEGLLIYVKPSLTGDESLDLQQYRLQNKEFPHEPTSDQLFDNEQVESYRQLGYHIGMAVCERIPAEHGNGGLWDCGDEIDAETIAGWFYPRPHRLPPQASALAGAELIRELSTLCPDPCQVAPAQFQAVVESEGYVDLTPPAAVASIQQVIGDKRRRLADRQYGIQLLGNLVMNEHFPVDRAGTFEALAQVAGADSSVAARLEAIGALRILGQRSADRQRTIDALKPLTRHSNSRIRTAAKNAVSNLQNAPRKPR